MSDAPEHARNGRVALITGGTPPTSDASSPRCCGEMLLTRPAPLSTSTVASRSRGSSQKRDTPHEPAYLPVAREQDGTMHSW